MSSVVRRRLFLVGALLVAGAALAFLAFGNVGESIVYYWQPTQVQQAGDSAVGATIRLGGLVKPGTLVFDPATQNLDFTVADEQAELRVHATGAPPEMFREGIGVLVEGTMGRDGVFQGRRVLVKHSNEYKPPENGKHLGDIYKSTEGL